MNSFEELRGSELFEVTGGCTWCKVGCTLIAVGSLVITGVTPVGLVLSGIGVAATWLGH